MNRDIKSHTLDQIEAKLLAWGQPVYRATQVTHWLYRRLATSWSMMTNLPRLLQERLADEYDLYASTLLRLEEAPDGTRKFLWQLADGCSIESVLIPATPALHGQTSDRTTLCVSTQVGCAYRCAFCASGLAGLQRNLGVDEIVEQLLAAERWHRQSKNPRTGQAAMRPSSPGFQRTGPTERIPSADAPEPLAKQGRFVDNLVVMGMGEPLANFDNLLVALRVLNAPWGGGIGARRITISTAGLAPQIRRLADEPLQCRLAISLHGATDSVRSRLMPVNRKYPLNELIGACEYYMAKKGRMITIEYILIAGVNDGKDQLKPLANLTRRLHAKINLIPYNNVEGLSWRQPDTAAQQAFWRALKTLGVPATLRHGKGTSIDAACGQLRLRTESMASAAHDGSIQRG